MLYRRCFGASQERRFLFASAESPSTPWKGNRLTRVLKALTKEVCNCGLGIQVYRQLSIAMTNRYLAQIRDPFNRFDDGTALADISVVFAWPSGHRPLQRGMTYGIDGAFSDSLQPALLRVYRWASVEWHKFLDATSEQESRCDLLTLETRPSIGKTSGGRKRQFQELLSPRKRLRQTADDPPNVNELVAARLPVPYKSTIHVCVTSSEYGEPHENGTHHPLLQH
jgi:hypothetical protein